MPVGSIEQALRDATGIKPKSKEARQAYLKRVQAKISDFSDAEWAKMSETAQLWANAASAANDKGQGIPDFEADGDEEEEAAPKGKGKPAGKGKAAANGTSKEAGAKKKAAPKEGKPASGTLDGSGIKVQIKKLLLKDPKMPVDKIMEKISGKPGSDGPSKFTVAGIRAEFRHSLKVLKQEDVDLSKLDI